jgi:hypothetical protein
LVRAPRAAEKSSSILPSPGWSPERLKALVHRATLLASGKPVEEGHLIQALESSGGQNRPAIEQLGTTLSCRSASPKI